jgi:hypothetical protein
MELTESEDSDDVIIALDAIKGEIASGGNGRSGTLRLKGAVQDRLINIDADRGRLRFSDDRGEQVTLGDGELSLGGGGTDGKLHFRNAEGEVRAQIGAGHDLLDLIGRVGKPVLTVDDDATLTLGGGGNDGDIFVRDRLGDTTMHFDGETADIGVGGNGHDGDIFVNNSSGQPTVSIHGASGNVSLGGSGSDGDLRLKDTSGCTTIHLDGQYGNATLGGCGQDGDVLLKDGDDNTTIHLDAQYGNATLGGHGQDGDLHLETGDGDRTVHLNAQHGNLTLGDHGTDGDVMLETGDGDRTIHLDAQYGNATLGGHGQDGDILLKDGNGTTRIHLDAQTGDIKLSGADCAEAFDVTEDAAVDPGTVLVTGEGFLEPSTRAYDSRVAGVVSGAGAYRPGIRLDSAEDGDETGRAPVALVGKVVCKVDADPAPIEVGDMLTTAETPGHAMKATDRDRAFGAIIGKALEPHAEGTGEIPILVALQ